MLQSMLRRHFETFARLRPANSGDLEALQNLEQHSPLPDRKVSWTHLLAQSGVSIITAHEGESLVGAAVWRASGLGLTSRLVWLGVCPSARGRGVGTLLIEAVVSEAENVNAGAVTADVPARSRDLERLLLAHRFQRHGATDQLMKYRRQLPRLRGATTSATLTVVQLRQNGRSK